MLKTEIRELLCNCNSCDYSAKVYLRELLSYRSLSSKKVSQLFKNVSNGSYEEYVQSRNKLVINYQPLVVNCAINYSKRVPYFSFSDLIQEGNIALINYLDNIRKTKVNIGKRIYIIYSIYRHYSNLMYNYGFICLPLSVKPLHKEVNKMRSIIEQKQGCEITNEVLIDSFISAHGFDGFEADILRIKLEVALSYDTPHSIDYVDCDTFIDYETYYKETNRENLDDLFVFIMRLAHYCLNDFEINIIKSYYLNGESLSSLSSKTLLTKERIRQQIYKAIEKIRNSDGTKYLNTSINYNSSTERKKSELIISWKEVNEFIKEYIEDGDFPWLQYYTEQSYVTKEKESSKQQLEEEKYPSGIEYSNEEIGNTELVVKNDQDVIHPEEEIGNTELAVEDNRDVIPSIESIVEESAAIDKPTERKAIDPVKKVTDRFDLNFVVEYVDVADMGSLDGDCWEVEL